MLDWTPNTSYPHTHNLCCSKLALATLVVATLRLWVLLLMLLLCVVVVVVVGPVNSFVRSNLVYTHTMASAETG